MSAKTDGTPGAFGSQADNPKRNLIVQKLQPPPYAKNKIMQDDKKREPINPTLTQKFIKGLKTFFGKGF